MPPPVKIGLDAEAPQDHARAGPLNRPDSLRLTEPNKHGHVSLFHGSGADAEPGSRVGADPSRNSRMPCWFCLTTLAAEIVSN